MKSRNRYYFKLGKVGELLILYWFEFQRSNVRGLSCAGCCRSKRRTDSEGVLIPPSLKNQPNTVRGAFSTRPPLPNIGRGHSTTNDQW